MKRYFIPILSISVVGIIVILLGLNPTAEKTAYVSIAKVYDSFALTKQLNAKFEAVKNERQLILDSLTIQLRSLELSLQQNSDQPDKLALYQKVRENYLYKRESIEETNKALSNQYNEQIMNQLNQYIADYGKEHGYVYIFGANGSGSIMYATENRDISDEITTYINKRFENKK